MSICCWNAVNLYIQYTTVPFSLNVPYPQFCWGFSPQTSHKCYCHSLHVGDSNHTYPLMSLASNHWENGFPTGNGCSARQEDCFLNPFVHRKTAVVNPEPTKAFLKLNTEIAMLSASFGCIHPPPPIPLFLLKQNLFPKDIAGSDITR